MTPEEYADKHAHICCKTGHGRDLLVGCEPCMADAVRAAVAEEREASSERITRLNDAVTALHDAITALLRERHAAIAIVVTENVAEEREACAAVADAHSGVGFASLAGQFSTAMNIAGSIRERGAP